MKTRIILSIFALICGAAFADTREALDSHILSVMEEGGYPGIAAAVIQGSSPLLQRGYGLQTVEGGQPVTEESIFQLGSITKSLTALAALQLEAQGLLDLDAPVVDYLPEFRTADQEKSDLITMRMLLNHTSGLPSQNTTGYRTYPSQDASLQALVSSLQGVTIHTEPGRAYGYSNVGYSLAGAVIAEVSGISFHSYMDRQVFQPLGMESTTLDLDRIRAEQEFFGHGWAPLDRAFSLRSPAYAGQGLEPAGARTITSLNDMVRYAQALMDRDNPVITEEFRSELWSFDIEYPSLSRAMGGQEERRSYGLGWDREIIDQRELIFHSGGTGGFTTLLVLEPAMERSVVLLVNTGDLDPYRFTLLITLANNLLHIAALEPFSDYGIPRSRDPWLADYSLSREQQGEYLGEYLISSRSGESLAPRELRIYQDGEDLMAELWTDQRFSLQRLEFQTPLIAKGISRGPAMEFRFQLNLEGLPRGLSCFGAEYRRVDRQQEGYSTRSISDGSWSFLMKDSWISGSENVFSPPQGWGALTIHLLSDNGETLQWLEDQKLQCERSYPEELFGREFFGQIYFYRSGDPVLICYSRQDSQWVILEWQSHESYFTRGIQEVVSPVLHSWRSQ